LVSLLRMQGPWTSSHSRQARAPGKSIPRSAPRLSACGGEGFHAASQRRDRRQRVRPRRRSA